MYRIGLYTSRELEAYALNLIELRSIASSTYSDISLASAANTARMPLGSSMILNFSFFKNSSLILLVVIIFVPKSKIYKD